MKKLFVLLFVVCAAFTAGWIAGKYLTPLPRNHEPVECDTTVTETRVPLPVERPESPDTSAGVGTVTVTLPRAGGHMAGPRRIRKALPSDTVMPDMEWTAEDGNDGTDVDKAAETEPPDSVAVVVPLTQHHYSGPNYEAWVSGYRARMDSIRVWECTREVTVHERERPKRWCVGIQAGYGFTPKGWQPYLGVGVSVRLFEF